MTDREMLEFAAKAAGIDRIWYEWDMSGEWGLRERDGTEGGLWNPLTNDGDALRLAVKLNLDIRYESYDAGCAVIVAGAWDDAPEGVHEIFERDGPRAVRRAITRAAAEIGKAMP